MCEPGHYPSLEQVRAFVQEQPADYGVEPVKISEAPPINITGGMDSVEYVRMIRDGDLVPDGNGCAVPAVPLTPRQREITQAYFAAGCRTRRAARALGIHSRRVRAVKALPAARVLLAELQAKTLDAVVQARAAQLLSPLL